MMEFSRKKESSINTSGQRQGTLSATKGEDYPLTKRSGESNGSDYKSIGLKREVLLQNQDLNHHNNLESLN